MSKESKSGPEHRGQPGRKRSRDEERAEAARHGRDADDFGPNEARAGDPGRESNRGGR